MSAKLAIFGAHIRTMDPNQPVASAIAASEGTIVAVGSNDEVREVCDASTQVLGGDGWAITPGLNDGHQHLFSGSERGRGVDFDRVADLDSVRALLAIQRQRIGSGVWLQGFSLEYAALGGRSYRHDFLDAASGPGPMMVISLDGHTAFVNDEALRLASIDGPRRFDDNSAIVCDENGRPTGELRERGAMNLVRSVIPIPSHQEKMAWYRQSVAEQNAVGLTSLDLMDGSFESLDILEELEAEGSLNLRVSLHYTISPTTDASIVDAIATGPKRAGQRWRAAGVKFFMDGVIETGTAWLEEPDTHGDGKEPMWPDVERYRGLVRTFHDAGFQVATHAIGDRAVREVLDTYRTLPGGYGRHRVEHIETVPDQTIGRFLHEGVAASMQPMHLRWMKPDLSDPWSERLGAHRCEHTMRSGDIHAAGALVVLGSDWPVASYDPRLGFFAAQLRRAPDLPDEGAIGTSRPLNGAETLAGYTVNAARANGQADVAGMLRPGYRADFVAWAEDPAECPPEDVTELPVLATVVDGVVVQRVE